MGIPKRPFAVFTFPPGDPPIRVGLGFGGRRFPLGRLRLNESTAALATAATLNAALDAVEALPALVDDIASPLSLGGWEAAAGVPCASPEGGLPPKELEVDASDDWEGFMVSLTVRVRSGD